MEEKTNKHVQRLHRYLPFDPAHDQIYEEYQKSEDSLELSTTALEYLRQICKKDPKLIILTGDAGHGKTHLARRLIEVHLGYSKDDARGKIIRICDGSSIINPSEAQSTRKPLVIYKDFSELSVDVAAERLEAAVNNTADVTTVICVNEGRLRAILESKVDSDACLKVLNDFKRSFDVGIASADGLIHIINLNYQSVASSKDGSSLLYRTLHGWLSGTRWQICTECRSSQGCPIFRNKQLLAKKDTTFAETRQNNLEALFATAEYLGAVITIREMLMVVSYIITGGLRCKDVHKRFGRKKNGWQHTYVFYNLLFSRPGEVSEELLSRISVLSDFSSLDPGKRATRIVDDPLINMQDVFPENDLDLQISGAPYGSDEIIDGSYGIDQIIGNPRNRQDRQKEVDFINTVVMALRRRAFFEDESNGHVMNKLGFEHGDDFLWLLCGETSGSRFAKIKNRLIAGLHTVQGLKLGYEENTLRLVDPAFGHATGHAAIISRRIPGNQIQIKSRSTWWQTNRKPSEAAVEDSVNWLDREVAVIFKENDSKEAVLTLDLMTFDYLMKAGSGFVAYDFYAHDIRKVTNFLGHLAEGCLGNDQNIPLFMDGHMYTVSIDNGVLQVSGGN